MAQLMPLPLTVSCSSKIQIGFTFLVPAYQVVLEKRPLNGCSCSSLHVYVIRSSWIWEYFHKGISLPQYSVLSFTRW